MKNTMSKFITSLEALVGAMFGAIMSFITPIKPFFWLTVGLVVLDTITGMIAARRRKEKLNSKGFSRILEKLTVYTAAIIGCYIVEIILELTVRFTYLAVGAIAFTELMSVLENTRVVSGANIAGVVGGLLSKFQKEPEREPESEEKSEE